MEIALFWFLSMVAVGEQAKGLQQEVTSLEAQVETLEFAQLRTMGAHSSLYANTELLKEEVENINERVRTLETIKTEQEINMHWKCYAGTVALIAIGFILGQLI